jgi:hypothetical protein
LPKENEPKERALFLRCFLEVFLIKCKPPTTTKLFLRLNVQLKSPKTTMKSKPSLTIAPVRGLFMVTLVKKR